MQLENNDGDNIYLVKAAPIPVGSALVVVGSDQKVVMEASDVLKVTTTQHLLVMLRCLYWRLPNGDWQDYIRCYRCNWFYAKGGIWQYITKYSRRIRKPNVSWLDSAGTVQQLYSTMSGAAGLDPLVLYSSAGEKVRFQTGGGISFNGDTAAANALDDYEEGTWTGSVSVNGFTQSVSSVAGRYTKIGRFVECHYGVTLSSAGYASGYSLWTRLPFQFQVLKCPVIMEQEVLVQMLWEILISQKQALVKFTYIKAHRQEPHLFGMVLFVIFQLNRKIINGIHRTKR